MAKRYRQLNKLIDEVQPAQIVEVGVHRARRSVLMCRRALKYRSEITFVGYDVFETMSEAFQREALNGKGVALGQEARARMLLDLPLERAHWSFVIGDTRETLHGRAVDADFVFIDGDHRLEVIRGDFAAFVGQATMVVFDDYFRPDQNGKMPDTDAFGANRIVDALPPKQVTILPVADPCHVGGVSHLAVVRLKCSAPD